MQRPLAALGTLGERNKLVRTGAGVPERAGVLCAVLTARLQSPVIPKSGSPAGWGHLKPSPRHSPSAAPRKRLRPAGWRARSPGSAAPAAAGSGARPGEGVGRAAAGLSRPAPRRACRPGLSQPALLRGAGPGAGRVREEHGEEPGLRRRQRRQSGSPAARRFRPGPSAAADAERDLHGHGRCAGGSSRGPGLRYHGGQGGRRRRHRAPR